MELQMKQIAEQIDNLKKSQQLDTIIKQKGIIQEQIQKTQEQNKKLEEEITNLCELAASNDSIISDEEYATFCNKIDLIAGINMWDCDIEEQISLYKEFKRISALCSAYLANKKMNIINI